MPHAPRRRCPTARSSSSRRLPERSAGAKLSLSGFPPFTTFGVSLFLDGTGVGPVTFTTDANGSLPPTGLENEMPVSNANATVTWSGGTLNQTLNRPCQTVITTVACSASVAVVGQVTACTATVSDAPTSAQGTPTGTVSFTTSGAGTFGGPCTLSGSGASASCSVSYTPSALGPESHVVTAAYDGDSLHKPGSGTTTVPVQRAVPTSKAQCTHDGWQYFSQFKNQGRCLAFVEQAAITACRSERAELGTAAFRAKYGVGRHHRHAFRRCVKLRGG